MSALLRAEFLKLTRQPATLFWGFFAVALVAALFKLLLDGMVFVRSGLVSREGADIVMSAAKALGISGNSLGHLLFAIGISSVFYTEYRYNTWRQLVPRAGRVELWSAKFLACLVFLGLGLFLVIFSDIVLGVINALLFEQRVRGLTFQPENLPTLAAAFSIALLELAVLAAIVSTITIITRSMIAAVIPAFLLMIGGAIVRLYLGPSQEVIPLPAFGAEALRNWLLAGAPAASAWSGLAILLVWLFASAGLGLAAFSRQQLSSE